MTIKLFLNGHQILSRTDVKTGYTLFPVDLKAFGLLKSGTNTMAVHCSSAAGASISTSVCSACRSIHSP